MRRVSVMGITAVAVALALATALAATSSKTPAPRAAPALAPAGDALDDGLESVDDDAWGPMDPMGSYVGPARGHAGAGSRRALERRHELLQQLDLTPAQRDKIESIRDKQRRAAIDQRAKLEIARLDLRALLRADKTNRALVDSKIDEIARMQAQMRKSQVGSMLDMRAVLTPEQQQKLHSLRGQ